MAELPDVQLERDGTLGAYVKFGEGIVSHTRATSFGIILYLTDLPSSRGIPDQVVAAEFIPGDEQLQDDSEDQILTTLQHCGLPEDLARDVYEALCEGRADADC